MKHDETVNKMEEGGRGGEGEGEKGAGVGEELLTGRQSTCRFKSHLGQICFQAHP